MSAKKAVGIFALPLTIDGVGADQVLPADAHINGVTLRIPPWVAPTLKPGTRDLLEVWIREPGASSETRFHSSTYPFPVVFPGSIHLPAQYLQLIGSCTLRYRVTAGDTGNEDDAIPQDFILRRSIPINLKEVTFPNATLWGYFNCTTSPPIWVVVIIRVPAQPGRFRANDVCELDWGGFTTLNGVNAIPGTALRLPKTLSQQEATSPQGFDFRIESIHYDKHIKPMEINASALASYTLYRNGVALGKSAVELVKFDRGIPGQSVSCGP
ncbi:hypothetical protein [Pseudomonas sp. TWP3-1]|uniref:hypothetical protein n=1 Tax=Pseudomonas sp. TWP3-1 TaxID=2804631 RepID=UPI003CE902C8